MAQSPLFGIRPMGWFGEKGDTYRQVLDTAVEAERLGFDVVYVGDRLLAEAHSDTGMSVYEGAMLEPFVILSTIAGMTERIRLAPLVAIVPFRHPAYMAKLTASLDIVSGGRFIFGAGAGWSDPELRMFDIDRRRRGFQMEEGLDIIRQLWTGEPVTYEGEFWQLEDVTVRPRPLQAPGPPVWFGSFSPDDAVTWSGDFTTGQLRSLRRIGRIGDGWAPLTYSAGHKCQLKAEQLGRGWEIISEAAEGVGRDPSAIKILYAHWIAIVTDDASRKACEEGLSTFFPGDFEQAKETYPIGAPEEIAEQIKEQARFLPRVDGYLFTPIITSQDHLERIAQDVRPLLSP